MAQAGASIEAFLKLDASDFKSNIKLVKDEVNNFKESFSSLESTSNKTSSNLLKDIEKLQASLKEIGADSNLAVQGFQSVQGAVNGLKESIGGLGKVTKDVQNFKTLAQGMNQAAEAAQKLTTVAQRDGQGIEALNSIMNTWRAGMESATVNVNGLASALKVLKAQQDANVTSSERVTQAVEMYRMGATNVQQATTSMSNSISQGRQNLALYHQNLRDLALGVEQFNAIATGTGSTVTNMSQKFISMSNSTVEGRKNLALYNENLRALAMGIEQFNTIETKSVSTTGTFADRIRMLSAQTQEFNTLVNPAVSSLEMLNSALVKNRESVMALITGQSEETVSLEKNSIAVRENGAERLRAMGYTGKLTIEEEKESASVEKNTQTHLRNANAMSQSSARANQLTTATSRLGRAMSSLRMMGTMVGSMLAYNFAHKLLVATGETIHAKSEMEGYFKMLNFGQSDVNHFNKALDDTVKQFQRVNKYSLGETISSIGVEFNLSTQEMEKAMKVTSMITSEYLRAGRNANEASLAVKDVLQGQFQRLSRETGVKGEQLKEAGWSGDTTDVLGLMEALEKVAKSRNWDVFAEKANSLNDILTIIQNRFGEWSADMVYSVQPAIVGTFNAIMDVATMFSQSFSGIWEWLNGSSWDATAVKIGFVTTSLFGLAQALVMYRGQMSLVEASQLGWKASIMTLITGLKGQQVAELGVRNSIMAKILGIKAETIAEGGVTKAIQEKIFATKLETVEEKLNTVSSEENTVAKKFLAIQERINKAEKEGLIAVEEADTLRKQLNTIATQGSILATTEQTAVTGGLTGALIALGGAENITAVATGELSVAMGILNGIIALSPIGWLTAGLIALAGAFYVATGGLSDHWEKMQKFNETVESGHETIQKNNEFLQNLGNTLGTTSKIYQDTADVVGDFNNRLSSSMAMVKAYKDEVGNIEINLTTKFDENLKSRYGFTDEDIGKFREFGVLDEGYDTYYHALQVIHKQEDNAQKTQTEILDKMDKRQAKDTELADKTNQIKEHEANLIKHSAEHNTSEDWWGGTWAGILAGIDSMQIWMDYATEDLASWYSDFQKQWNAIPEQLSNAWNNIDWGALGDIGGRFSQWIDDVGKSLNDSWKSLTEMFDNNIKKPIMDWWNGFISFDWLFSPVSASDGSSDHPSFMEDLSAIFGFDVQAWIDSFNADPLGTLGVTSTITDITSFLTSLIPTSWESVYGWVDSNIIQPFTSSISTGIANIPLVFDILALFGLVNGENTGSSQKGRDLGDAFKTAIEDKIRGIPILGDILQLLGVIPQANGDAHSKGEGVGSNIKTGTQSGMSSLGSMIIQEFTDALNGIGKLGQQAYDTAKGWADKLWQGVNSVLQRHSPGFFHDQFQLEFGTDIPNAINESGATAYSVAQSYAQNIKQGIQDSGTTTIGMDGMVQDYQSDAQIISDSSQMMGMTTTTAFNDMALQVNATTGQMQTNVTGTYSAIASNQTLSLNQMKQQNTSAYNEMYLKSNQSLVQMRDSTSNITQQMTSAWNHMKDSIVASANKLKNDSTVHFNSLSDTIGSFYRKIQNPSNWGGSPHGGSTHRNVRAGRSFASTMRGFAGGRGSTYTGSNTMTIASLKKKICPNGDCNGIFDGWNSTDVVDVRSFLSLITDGGFGWGDWSGNHFNYIRDTSNQWGMKSPTIQLVGGIPTNANYKVGDFANGSPKISFGSFQSMAESIYSAIPYRFYYNSDWKGSWLGALQSGACNCYDGALSLIAFANACGFSGSMASGTWTDPDGTSYPHVWAVINGKKMDTTAWQQRGSWSAGSPNIRTSNSNPQTNNNTAPVNIEVNINGNVYGVDDLDRHIEEGIDKGLEKHFNTSYTVGV